MGDLDTLLSIYEQTIVSNYGNVKQLMQPTFIALMTIDLVWGALIFLLDGRMSFIPFLVGKVMRYGFFLWLFREFEWIVNSIIDSFALIGAAIGGDNTSIIQSPSIMIDKCYSLVHPLWVHATENSISIMNLNVGQFFTLFLVMFFICLSFFIMIIQAVVTYIELYIICIFTMVLIPFGVHKRTCNLAEKAIGGLISVGIKVAVLQAILSISCNVLNGLAVDVVNNDLKSYMVLCCSCLICAFLSWQAPSVVSGLLSGSPMLSASMAAATVSGGASATASGYHMAKESVKGIAKTAIGTVAAATRIRK